jgi:Arm DNA-binding domain
MPDRLTQQFVADLDADGRDRLIFDERLPGFGIRVTAAGAKIFVAQARAGGRLHRVAVARFPDKSVMKAREAARCQSRSRVLR